MASPHSTPWGEIQQPTSHLSVYEALPPPQKPSRATTPQPGTVVKEEESMTNWIPSSATSSTSSLGTKDGLARPLTDKVCLLYQPVHNIYNY